MWNESKGMWYSTEGVHVKGNEEFGGDEMEQDIVL